MRILLGRLYQCNLSPGAIVSVWDSPYGTLSGSMVHRLKGGDVILVVGHTRGKVVSGDWWLQVLCNGVHGYVRTGRVRGNLTEVKQ